MENHRINSCEITSQPTEDKYSMVPLRIKGFLPQQNGSAIMLPAEITTLSGSDFDVDKLYIMLPEFKIRKTYNLKKAWQDFYIDPTNADISNEINKNLELGIEDYKRQHPNDADLNIDDYLEFLNTNGVKKYQLSETAQKRFSKWFKSRKSNYYAGSSIEKVKYDYNKLPQEQSLEARNNALIDLMWSILTNEDTAHKILNPGGFDKQKAAARVVTILEAMSDNELAKEGYTRKDLLNLSIKKLDALVNKYKRKLDPLSPRTQVLLHQQNMTGNKMIGIYANHNANHALMQHTRLALSEENGAFFYNGVKRTSLHGVKNEKGEFISRNNANYLAAAVDNVKDNTLHATNQNSFTGDVSMLLSRLGYNPTEIAILMKQPIVVNITNKFFRESREGKSKNSIIKEVLETTGKYAGMVEDLSYANIKNNLFDLDVLMKDIQLYKNIRNVSKEDRINFYRRQVAVGLLFQRIMKSADCLKQLVSATRADTQNGGAGPTIADNIINIQKVRDFLTSISSEKSPLVAANVILIDIPYNINSQDKEVAINALRKQLLKSPLPFLQAFYTLGVEQTQRMLGKYFPHFTKPFQEVLYGKYDEKGNIIFEGLAQMTKSGKLDAKTINSIFNDLLMYIMSKTEFFGGSVNKNGEIVSSSKKRSDFINNFPAYFKKVINNNEDIAELEFIKRLRVLPSNANNPIDTIIFSNVGSLTSDLRERYMRDWAALLHMNNPKAQELALNLFLYSYYRNGFAFGPSTFIHLTPTVLRDAVPNYISTLRQLMDTSDEYGEFIEQYILNHLNNKTLVPEVPEDSSIKFTESDGTVKDEVIIEIDDEFTSSDKTIIRKEVKDENDTSIYIFHNFISKRIGTKQVYYRLERSGETSVTYIRVEPLGYKNNFLEYEYGKSALEMESVIEANKKNYNSKSQNEEEQESESLTETMLDVMPDVSDAYSEEAIASMIAPEAFKAVYGEEMTPINIEDFDSIPVNEDYRDANDEEICGDAVEVAVL